LQAQFAPANHVRLKFLRAWRALTASPCCSGRNYPRPNHGLSYRFEGSEPNANCRFHINIYDDSACSVSVDWRRCWRGPSLSCSSRHGCDGYHYGGSASRPCRSGQCSCCGCSKPNKVARLLVHPAGGLDHVLVESKNDDLRNHSNQQREVPDNRNSNSALLRPAIIVGACGAAALDAPGNG